MKREIKVEYSYTKNLGNFESCRITVGLTRELGPKQSETHTIDEDFEFVRDMVHEKIEVERRIK